MTALFCVFVLIAAVMTGCGEEPLEKAYNDLEKMEEEQSQVDVRFDEEKDTLQIGIYDGADLDALFETLDKDLEEAEIGKIYFTTYYSVSDDQLTKLSEKIGEMPVASIDMLGVNAEIADANGHGWIAAAPKADKLFIPYSTAVSSYTKEELKGIEKVWTGGEIFDGIGLFPDLKEFAVDAEMEIEQEDTAEQEKAPQPQPSGSPEEALEKAASQQESGSEEAVSGSEEASSSEGSEEAGEESGEETVDATLFDPNSVEASDFMPLKNAEKLERLLIMPTEPAYRFETMGAGYIFGIQNAKPAVMINKPDEAFSEDNMVKAIDVNVDKVNQNAYIKESILNGFLREEVEGCYSKGIKFDKSSKSPAVTGKALVFKANPGTDDWASKRKYYSDGELISGVQLDGKLKTPQYSKDYDTFIYVYPVYTRTGIYTSGTKAYTETYMAQVFDLKNKIAYEPQKIGSAAAPQSFSYPAGSPPSKKSGDVSQDKILSFLKKLKTAK